jgi:hypothetical protein
MVQLSTTEHALVDDLLECLAVAMDRTPDADPAYANKTKLQKLLYLAVDEFDLPLTYSWYLAGAVVPGDPVSPAGLATAFDSLPSPDQPGLEESASPSDHSETRVPQPKTDELDEFEDANVDVSYNVGTDEATDSDRSLDPVMFSDSVIDSADTGPDPDTDDVLADRRDDIIDFYAQTLPDVWHQNTMQFLQNFYLSHAPDEYQDIYLQSTHLRTRLREVEQAIEATLADEAVPQDLDALVKAVGLEVSDLHYSIRKSDSLAATLELVVRGTDLIEDGLLMLSKLDPEELTPQHREVVVEMQEFFYYTVWRLPCLIISQETATGPSADKLRAQRQETLTSFDDRLREKCDAFERTLERTGLKPGYADYDLRDDEVGETAAKLTEKYFE